MHHSFIDEHSHIDGVLQRLDPRIKIVSFVALLFFIIFSRPDSLLSFALYGLLILLLIGISKIPVYYILKRCLVIVPFILMTSLFLLFVLYFKTMSCYCSLYLDDVTFFTVW